MKNQMRVIKTFRKAGITDYARAAAKASPVINGGQDHIVGDIIGLGKDIAGIFKKKPGKISKSDFYKKRDTFYKTVESLGKPVGNLPGNPFAQFSHATIKDSPFKDYQNEWKAFEQMASIYYPELYGAAQSATVANTPKANEVAKPLENVMNNAIRNGGAIPPRGDMNATLEEFNNTVMQPAGAGVNSNAGSEALGNAAIEFIATLMDKKKNGEMLPPIYDQIASNGLRVQEKVEAKVRTGIQGNIGSFVTDNIILIGLALIILIIAMNKK